MNKKHFQKKQVVVAVAAALLGIAGPLSAQDTSQRVEELEEA